MNFRIIVLTAAIVQILFSVASAQTLDKNKQYYLTSIGFYNVENLYDTIDSPDTDDSEFLPNGGNRYTGKIYKEKLEHLSKVISEMADKTPDGLTALGVAEIENESVLRDLANMPALKKRNYKIVHYDSPDRRGVDVAFFYNPSYFEYTSSKKFRLTIAGDTNFRSRDQLLVSGKMLGEEMHFIVAHWPSRRGGEKKSQHLRIAAARIARGIMDSLIKVNPEAKVILMGDLNDDPTNKSITEVMKANGSKELKPGEFYNPMTSYFKKGIGTIAYQDSWGLFDQMILTPAFIKESCDSFRFYSANVFNKPYLRNSTGRFQDYPFRTFVGGTYQGGYSDHFPVYLYLVKERTN